ncbi:hypothetical protein TSOC_004214, partial [Tetrabaena socialis]
MDTVDLLLLRKTGDYWEAARAYLALLKDMQMRGRLNGEQNASYFPGGSVTIPVFPQDIWVTQFQLNTLQKTQLLVGDSRFYHSFEFSSNAALKYTFGYEGQTIAWNGTPTNYMSSAAYKQVTVRIRNGTVSVWYDDLATPGASNIFEVLNSTLNTNTFLSYDYGSFRWSNLGAADISVKNVDIRNLTVFENPCLFSTELYAETMRAKALTVKGTVTCSNLVPSDWSAVSGPAQILNKPSIAKATSPSFSNASLVSGIAITGSDPGDMISKRYAAGDRYGLGQYTGGATRLFTSGTYGPAS